MAADAVEEHVADYGDDGGFHVRGHLILRIGGGGFGALCVLSRWQGCNAGQRLGEEVADAEDDGLEGGGAGAVECDAALGEEGVEASSDYAFEEGELVGVVGVEGGAVNACGVGDFLDGEAVEVVCFEQPDEGLLEELTGAADTGIGRITGGVGHGVSGLEYARLGKDCCLNDDCCVSMSQQVLFTHQLL